MAITFLIFRFALKTGLKWINGWAGKYRLSHGHSVKLLQRKQVTRLSPRLLHPDDSAA